MAAEKIIEEFKSLPSDERTRVRKFFQELETAEIPASFWRGLQETDEGKVFELREEHFDKPPAY
jgi:hypothetical protein